MTQTLMDQRMISGLLAEKGTWGFRNKLINGDFDVWQRATSQTASGYGSDDRWRNEFAGGSLTHSRQGFANGQLDVPGDPQFFSRSVVVHAAGAANFHSKAQYIEGVQTLEGKRATVTFWAKADAAKDIAIELVQNFGTGGSPSATVFGIGVRRVTLSAVWQRFSFTVDIPSIAGAARGTNLNDFLALIFWFEAGSNYNARTLSLGQQSGTFDIAHVSIVEGDATSEADPFTGRHPQQELALCQRYYEVSRYFASTYCGVSYFVASGSYWFEQKFSVQKRAVPTFGLGAGSWFAGTVPTTYIGVDGVQQTAASNFYRVGTSGAVAFTFDAEL